MNFRSSLVAAFVLTGAALFAGGCTSTPAGTLNGDVTLDGAPLKEGVVRLVPTDGKGTTSTAPIADGKFHATAPVGEYRIEFSAPKNLGTKSKMYNTPDSKWVDDVGELIPDKYNVKSEFKVAIQRGSQEKHFELTSK